MLRIALFFSLFAAIASGAWATFRDPTPESAAAIMNPTTEQVAEAQGWVTPFFEWITGLTPTSIGQLIDDAIDDVKASLGDEPLVPPQRPSQSVGPPARWADGSVYGRHGGPLAPSATPPGSAEKDQQPGIDWYREKK